MELVTTVREFTHEIIAQHLSPDTHIRVIIDEAETSTKLAMSSSTKLPSITSQEQKAQLNRLPSEPNPSASAELIQLIEASHTNTEPLDI